MRPRTLAAIATAAALLLTPTAPAEADPNDRAVARWTARTATTVERVGRLVGDATVVGLGEQVHGAKEVLRLKLRVLRVLVERKGFRSLAWEDDWTLGLEIDRWVKTGEGDIRALIRQMSTAHHNREVLRTLEWIRSYNKAHAMDPVSLVGVEYWTTRHSAYDAVRAYVARHAPGQLAEVKPHLTFLTPPGEEIGDWPQVYGGLSAEEKAPYLQHARALRRLVADCLTPKATGGTRWPLTTPGRSATSTSTTPCGPTSPTATRTPQPAVVAALLRRQGGLLGGQRTHGRRADRGVLRGRRAGRRVGERGVVPGHLVRQRVLLHRVHPRQRQLRGRGEATSTGRGCVVRHLRGGSARAVLARPGGGFDAIGATLAQCASPRPGGCRSTASPRRWRAAPLVCGSTRWCIGARSAPRRPCSA